MKIIKNNSKLFDERLFASRFIRGKGIEIGACQLPLFVDKSVARVKYVDKLTAGQIRKRFPELKNRHIVKTDVICDVDKSPLPFADLSLDFVIANHFLEHCLNPLGVIKEIHRVLKNFGILYLAIPDKRYTFDKKREMTKISHLIRDFDNNMQEIEETHLIDFIVKAAKINIPQNTLTKKKLFANIIKRGIHTHVWTWRGMTKFIIYMIKKRGTTFDLLELFLPKKIKNEVIFILQKRIDLTTEEAVRRYDSSLAVLLKRELVLTKILPKTWYLKKIIGSAINKLLKR